MWFLYQASPKLPPSASALFKRVNAKEKIPLINLVVYKELFKNKSFRRLMITQGFCFGAHMAYVALMSQMLSPLYDDSIDSNKGKYQYRKNRQIFMNFLSNFKHIFNDWNLLSHFRDWICSSLCRFCRNLTGWLYFG